MNASLLPSLAIGALTLSSAGAIAADALPTEDRVTRTAEGPALDHAADELRDPTSLQTTRRSSAEIERKPRATAKSANALRAAYGDSYIYDATTAVRGSRR